MLFIVQNLQKVLLIQFGITESWNWPTKIQTWWPIVNTAPIAWIFFKFAMYRIRPIKRTVPPPPPPPPPPYFSWLEGEWLAQLSWKTRKTSTPPPPPPPIRSKKSKITYLSSCRVCKPALNSTISAVPSRSHCSYSPHDRTFDQLTIFSHLSKLISESAKVQ